MFYYAGGMLGMMSVLKRPPQLDALTVTVNRWATTWSARVYAHDVIRPLDNPIRRRRLCCAGNHS
jgi:dihydroxy-acid dehydratase